MVDDKGRLIGLLTYKDITKVQANPNACKDAKGRLRVAAGVGVTHDTMERVAALYEANVDAIVIDTAHGHSIHVANMLKKVKAKYPDLDVVVGNIATAEAAKMLVEAGADGVKVGIGPGSICTTRIIAGIGMPQLSAIYEVAHALEGKDVPVIADGGLRYSGDIVKALAAGADSVMAGSLFAGVEESPERRSSTTAVNSRLTGAWVHLKQCSTARKTAISRIWKTISRSSFRKESPRVYRTKARSKR